MAQRTDIFSLGRLGLSSGEGRKLDLHATLDPFELGAETYTPVPAAVPLRLDVSRTTGNGYALRLAETLGLSKDFGPNVAAYWQRLQQRDGYKRAVAAETRASEEQKVPRRT